MLTNGFLNPIRFRGEIEETVENAEELELGEVHKQEKLFQNSQHWLLTPRKSTNKKIHKQKQSTNKKKSTKQEKNPQARSTYLGRSRDFP